MNTTMYYLTLDNTSKKQLASISAIIEQIIDCMHRSHKSAIALIDDAQFCLKMRRNRKQFKSILNSLKKQFLKLPESKQVELELAFYQMRIKLEKGMPELDDSEKSIFSIPFIFFLKRELRLISKMFSDTQTEMSNHLYKNNYKDIINNSELLKEINDSWGDLAKEG